MSDKPIVPLVDADGNLIAHAGRYARSAVLLAFEGMGGVEAMTQWAMDNPTQFYTKLFPKVIDREPVVAKSVSVEDLLDELDSRMIDVTPAHDSEPAGGSDDSIDGEFVDGD